MKLPKNYLNALANVKFINPDKSYWECEMFGTGRDMVFIPVKGNKPCWFWRWMQWLCFGNKWIKKGEASKNV